MTDVIKIANERRAKLVAEVGKIDEFIRMAEAIIKAGRYHGAVFDMDGRTPAMLSGGIGYDLDLLPDDMKPWDGVAGVSTDSSIDLPYDHDGQRSTARRSNRILAIGADDHGSTRVDLKGIASVRHWIKGFVDTAFSNLVSRSRIERRLAELEKPNEPSARAENIAPNHGALGRIASMRLWIANIVGAAGSNLMTIEQLRDQWALEPHSTAKVGDTVTGESIIHDSSLPFGTERTSSLAAFRAGTGRPTATDKISIAEDELVLTNPLPSDATPVDVHVGQRLRQRRWMMGMTQQQLGDLIGVNLQQIQNYESGASRISAGRMWDVAMAIGVPVLFFFEGLDGQVPDTDETRVEILTDHEADELVRAYCAIPEDQRQRLFDLARVLSEAA
jgi:transcriptional regulator with XRE-family HTH domain